MKHLQYTTQGTCSILIDVTADDDKRIDLVLPKDPCAGLHAFSRCKAGASRGLQHRAAFLNNVGYARGIHFHEIVLQKALITSPDAKDREALLQSAADHCADRRVHTRRVSAACQHRNLFDITLHFPSLRHKARRKKRYYRPFIAKNRP